MSSFNDAMSDYSADVDQTRYSTLVESIEEAIIMLAKIGDHAGSDLIFEIFERAKAEAENAVHSVPHPLDVWPCR